MQSLKLKITSLLGQNRRNLSRKAWLRAGDWLLKKGRPRTALKLARALERGDPKNPVVLRLNIRCHEALGNKTSAKRYRHMRLRHLMPRHMRQRDFPGILKNMALMERTERRSQFSAGKMVAEQLGDEAGRAEILRAAREVQKGLEDSAFLAHLISLCQAMQGEYREASKELARHIHRTPSNDASLEQRRSVILRDAWRAVDLVAREQMDWADAEPGYRTLFQATSDQTTATAEPLTAGSRAAEFKEHALQGRMRPEYLMACDAELSKADTLAKKFAAISDMLRPSVRHIPDYGPSHELARTRFLEMGAEYEPLLESAPPGSGTKVPTQKAAERRVLDLCSVLKLSRRLGRKDLRQRSIARLLELSEDPTHQKKLWFAAAELVADEADAEAGDLIMRRIMHLAPRSERDLRSFFRWAMVTGRYKEADEVFSALPEATRRAHGVLYYVNILQRQGRLEEALGLLGDIHGQLLANPSRVNAFSNHSLIKRAGELRFLIETARIFQRAPQPTNPKGVVLIAPRNVDHLRRYPLMVLLELKRRGWAVIPMVEGLLPKEPTGDPALDVMNGAISPNIRLSPEAEAVIPEVSGFVSDPSHGELRWGPIDLSHSMWEDAAINRRRYSINYSCPELQVYLANLAKWTRAMARILDYARELHEQSDMRMACISLFNCRLPDSLFRFYCEKYGDQEDFFYLHAANGYQNYFTNFSTNISRRFALRNMTRSPHVRSSSFPLPENFERYYQETADKASDALSRFKDVTRVKRSTAGMKTLPLEATEASRRIAAWRADGGKVACAFGKVVCDSSVPFDGGPAHRDMKDWINHCIEVVQGTRTLLLIKPHPHEMNNQIATFPTEYFSDLLTEPLGDNAMLLGHKWFDMHDMQDKIDLGLIYNGTTTVELGLMGVPCVLAGHFAPIDYPVGHLTPRDRKDFEAYLRFEKVATVAPDIRERSAVWLDYMANEDFTLSYRYHARPVTNKVLYPPWWEKEDLGLYFEQGDPSVSELADRALGISPEPGAEKTAREPARID